MRDMATDKAGQLFVAGLVGGVVEKATKTYLKEEGEMAVLGGLITLPARGSGR